MDFNQRQQAAIESTARNLLVLAGAGTGKTRTIIGRARHLIGRGVSSDRIAILTFTRRSAREIRERLFEESGDSQQGVLAGTFHYFCLGEMRAHPKWFGFVVGDDAPPVKGKQARFESHTIDFRTVLNHVYRKSIACEEWRTIERSAACANQNRVIVFVYDNRPMSKF